MMKKKNSGFSMVEILVSLAIFVMLMIPIVAGIISSLKASTGSKELQYRNDYAENLMEHVKSVPLQQLTDSDYYYSNGTTAGTFAVSSPTPTTYSADYDSDGVNDKEANATKYDITGKVQLGTQKTSYNYRIEVDNNYYVQKGVEDPTFLDPNNLALGVVEDIDYRKVALIDGTIINYDLTAAKTYRAKKLQYLKDTDEKSYKQQMEGTNDLFVADEATRLIRVKVSGSKTTGYTVKCILNYLDDSSYLYDKDRNLEYTPYANSYETELPNIYLMYNPFFYNGGYPQDDYVVIDVSELDDNTDVKLYFIEIAQQYSQNLIDSGLIKEEDKDRVLYNNQAANNNPRSEVCIHMGVAKDSANLYNDNIYVYHNIGDNKDELNNDKRNYKTILRQFWYKHKDALTNADKMNGVSAVTFDPYVDFGRDIGISFLPLVSYDETGSAKEHNATVKQLNEATENNRALYNVKIWLKKESDGAINPATEEPILEGTKGGNDT